ncbi:hypothetical protein Tco_1453488 [Tanacetum coccineum]
MVGSGNRFVYDQNPYSYNETPNFFNQPPPHQIETYLFELCGIKSHHGFDCQTGNTLVYEQVCGGPNYRVHHNSFIVVRSVEVLTIVLIVYEPNPYNNYDLPHFDQPPQYHIDQSPPRDLESERLSKIKIDRLREDVLSTQIPNTFFDLDNEESDDDTEVIFDNELFLRERNTTHVTPQSLTYTPPPHFLATMEPLDTLLMGDEFEVTLVSTDLECSMPIDLLPLPCTDVLGDAKVDIDLPFGGHLDTLSTGDRKIDFNPSDLETIDPVPDPRMFDVPLSNDDSISRSFYVTISNPLFDFDDNYSLIIDNKIFNDDFEDLCSLDPTKSTLIIDEATLLVTPLPIFKDISLREVERFDPFFSPAQSGDMTWVMERPSYRFPHMPLPCQVPYSPKVVMYRYFHPTLILSDRCVLEPRSK